MKRIAAQLALGLALLAAVPAHAVELHISAKALEKTLAQQLFTGDQNRYYMRGDPHSACFVYAEDPKVSFKDDRILIHVQIHAKLGTAVGGKCLGVGLNTQSDVSVVPDAEGESIGFRDARVEKLSDSRELNFLLTPFLSHKLPASMKINAADQIRQLLTQSTQSTGYALTLNSLKIHSMVVEHGILSDSLVVDMDADFGVDSPDTLHLLVPHA
jgi:hypothetical protein